jgi:hypothetical protein
MAVTMLRAGYPPADVCQLFALHTETGACDEIVSIDSVASSMALAMPLGLTVQTALGDPEGLAQAHLVWEDISPDGAGFLVEVFRGEDSATTQDVPYSRRASLTLHELPLGQELVFSVVTRNGDVLGAPATARAWTPPEPVRHVDAVQRDFVVRVTWPAVAASEYVVEMTEQGSDDWWEAARTTESRANISGIAPGRTYEFRVVSVNGAGEPSAYPSPPATVHVREVQVW